MKLTIVAMTIPYPSTDGGRIDVWRRIKGLSNLGVEIQLICWAKEQPNKETVATIEAYVQNFYPIIYRSTPLVLLQRAVGLISYPLEVTSRFVRGKEWDSLLKSVQAFKPDIILSDHVHCGLLSSHLSKILDVPMVTRSHDIEYLHYRYQFKSAKGWNKLQKFFSVNHLEQYEKSILRQSQAFYDISKDDLQFWKSQDMNHGYFLPPMIELPEKDISSFSSNSNEDKKTEYDVVFLGNLWMDNNVAGVTWFIKEVVPLLQEKKPDITILISGSSPVQSIREVCAKTGGVSLISNPASAKEIYDSGRILIDPVSLGSGVSIKSIEMLAIGKPIVSTPKGTQGLPDEVKRYFRVAANATAFADEILDLLVSKKFDKPDQNILNSLFGKDALRGFISHLEAVILSSK